MNSKCESEMPFYQLERLLNLKLESVGFVRTVRKCAAKIADF